jgi:epoxyqueuosine reductase
VHEGKPNSAHENALTRERVRALAIEAGFTDAGLAPLPHANEERDATRFERWIAAGRAGAMQYLERRGEGKDGAGELARARARTPFPWARSAIVCWASYDSGGPRSIDANDPGAGWIARYALTSQIDNDGARRPSDYHRVLLKRLRALEAKLRGECGEFEARAYVDTGPIVERSLAVAAGLGWTGKNTCVIHPALGSFGFLAVLITSLQVSESAESAELAPQPAVSLALKGHGFSRAENSAENRGALAPEGNSFEVPDRCGSCTRCIEACPTGALVTPYQMDARRCISYLTIEHKAPIEEELMGQMGRQVFGCDICQDVCPWNQKALGKTQPGGPITVDQDLKPRPELVNPALDWLASLDEGSFEREFNGSPVRRAGFAGLRRNVAIAMGNSGVSSFLPRLEQWAEEADEGLRKAARWALARLRK